MDEIEEIFQKIVENYTIQNAYENWADYRKRVTDYLIKYTQQGKTIAILGVGESNDIDLKRLYEHTGNLTLVDKNQVGMTSALKKYALEDAPNIELVQKDFVGISDAEYKDIIGICLHDMKEMGQSFSPLTTAPKVIKKMDEFYSKVNSKDVELGIEQHDYVVAIGVASQLNSFIEHVWSIFLQVIKKTDSTVANRASQQNDIFIPKFCKAIENTTLERMFVGVEILEVQKQSGVQGAQQTIKYFRDNTPMEELILYQDVWPLLPYVTYQMGIFNKKK